MNLSIISFDGHNINDTTNYVATFPLNTVMLGQDAEHQWVDLAYLPPEYTTSHITGGVVYVQIDMRGTIHSQMDELRKWFAPTLGGKKKLLVKDTANSDKQYRIYGVAKKPTGRNGTVVTFPIEVGDQTWAAETETTTAWPITSSGDTQVVVNAGNRYSAPIIRLTPTAVKTGGTAGSNLYTGFLAVFNRTAYGLAGLPYDIFDNAWDTSVLIADNGNKAQINVGGGINAAVTTIPYDTVTGTLSSSGMMKVENEQFSYTGKTGTTSGNLTGVTRGIGGTTAATHADNVEMKTSYMQNDGRDVRVYDSGVEMDRWLDDWNTNNSSVWINGSWSANPLGVAATGLTLNTAIAGSGAISTITVTSTEGTGINFFSKWNLLPSQGLLQIESEIFRYTSKTGDGVVPVRFGGVTRAVRGSAEAAHTTTLQVKWIERDITVTFGDASATAPVIPDSRKPMIDIDTSTNTSHVWLAFYDSTGTRPLAWSSYVSAPSAPLNTSHVYTANQNTSANPATDMGGSVEAYQQGSTYYSPASIVSWEIFHPEYIDTITATGEKFRVGSTWPLVRCIKRPGVAATVLWTEPTPASASSWGSISSHSAVAVGSQGFPIRFEMSGSVSKSSGAMARVEYESVTFALNSSYTPTVTKIMSTPAPVTGANIYTMDGILSNDTKGQSIRVKYDLEVNQTLEIDCARHVVTYLKDNSPAFSAVLPTDEDSFAWIDLDPGNNTLSWTELGVVAITGSVIHRDMMQ